MIWYVAFLPSNVKFMKVVELLKTKGIEDRTIKMSLRFQTWHFHYSCYYGSRTQGAGGVTSWYAFLLTGSKEVEVVEVEICQWHRCRLRVKLSLGKILSLRLLQHQSSYMAGWVAGGTRNMVQKYCSFALRHALLYHLLKSKWEHNLQWTLRCIKEDFGGYKNSSFLWSTG